ncbi:hypothetical protein CHU98_g5264 [Xylaria longipes]|nr:hypothetical protein CHU98_g5264 [Xylaria longipes]
MQDIARAVYTSYALDPGLLDYLPTVLRHLVVQQIEAALPECDTLAARSETTITMGFMALSVDERLIFSLEAANTANPAEPTLKTICRNPWLVGVDHILIRLMVTQANGLLSLHCLHT